MWCDNLYMSCRFAKAAFNGKNKVLLTGVTRTDKRGLPLAVVQEVVKKEAMPTTRGTTKAAVLIGDSECPNLVAVSVYDTKPAHFLTMAAGSIEWTTNKRKVWHKGQRKLTKVDYLRLNVNNDYNYKMNSVDMADQLRNQCRMDHWLRQRKWWWSIFLWGQGVLLTNTYITHCRVQELNNVPKHKRLTHYDFLHSVATAWINRDEMDVKKIRRLRHKKRKLFDKEATTPSPIQKKRQHAASDHHDARSTTSKKTSNLSQETPARLKAPRVNDNTLHPDSGSLRGRLNHIACFHCPELSPNVQPCCSLHRWIFGRDVGSGGQVKEKVFLCSVCQVNLCIPCFKVFHTTPDLGEHKQKQLN